MTRLTRITLVCAAAMCMACPAAAQQFQSAWQRANDQTWVGASYWANRLQDWRVADGRLECVDDRNRPMRTVHLLTHRLSPRAGAMDMVVRTGVIAGVDSPDAKVGFLIGVGGQKMDYRAAAIVHGFGGNGAGVFAGIRSDGQLFIIDYERGNREKPGTETTGKEKIDQRLSAMVSLDLRIHAESTDAGCIIVLSVHEAGQDAPIAQIRRVFTTDRLVGNVALVSHPGEKRARFWFENWSLSGDKVLADAFARVGPILSTQHTLSRGVLKLTAQLMPVAEIGQGKVSLQIGGYSNWRTIATTPVIRPGFTAPFRIPHWNDTIETPYRVVYKHTGRDSIAQESVYEGIIRPDPIDKQTIVLAALSCNHNNAHNLAGGWGATNNKKRGDWANLMWFPHQDMVANLVKHEPDVLFFAGDQLYEGASPTRADRKNIMLDYLYKWYLWCWAYRDLTRDLPTITIPDDHDVYQGNIWGAGGRPTKRDNKGGYVHPAEFVKMVQRTQTSHLPDPYDPTPIEQGIGVYYTSMTYGRVSLAILEDRKFKSGCADPLLPPSGTGRPDHFNDPAFDTADLNLPHLKLLGERQLAFLDDWASDWRGTDMKVALSQTVFANMATHHGKGLRSLIADLDSNGWPQDGRDRAVAAIRRGFAMHVAGDQHIATAIQHGIDEYNDAMWSFCVPAIANFYPRKWMPPRVGANRKQGEPAWLGEHVDGFGNLVTVHAVANPTPEGMGREPRDLHDGMAGYGIIRFDKTNRQTTIECWPRFADPDDSSTGGQYAGWPIVIDQVDNFNPPSWSKLPEIRVKDAENAVFQVIDEGTGEVVYTIRIKGSAWQPHVPAGGTYTVRVGVPERNAWATLEHLKPTDDESASVSVSVR